MLINPCIWYFTYLGIITGAVGGSILGSTLLILIIIVIVVHKKKKVLIVA